MTKRPLIDATFAELEQAAVNGERCPLSVGGPLNSAMVSRLAHDGKIRVEIFRHNWRVVTILVGQNAGKKTAPEPTGATRPFRVVDADGHRLNGVPVDGRGRHRARTQPSAPRDYSKGREP